MAPWWPFGSGSTPVDYGSDGAAEVTALAGTPDAVLDSMEPLSVKVGSAPFVELLRPLYGLIV